MYSHTRFRKRSPSERSLPVSAAHWESTMSRRCFHINIYIYLQIYFHIKDIVFIISKSVLKILSEVRIRRQRTESKLSCRVLNLFYRLFKKPRTALTQSVTRPRQTTATRATTAAIAPLFCGDDAGILLLLFATLVGGPSPSDCH